MWWPEHLILNRLILGKWHWGAILPDIPMLVLYYSKPTVRAVDTDTLILYFIPHSILCALLLACVLRFNAAARNAYLLHILCDIVSHTGEWSIRPFYPLSNVAIGGAYDAYFEQ